MKKQFQSKQTTIKYITELRVSRRNFIKNAMAAGLVSSTAGFLFSCDDDNQKGVLNESQEKILISIQNILFPKDDTGPSAYEVSAHEYVKWWLTDTRIDSDEKNYVLKGLKWVDETAQETHEKRFLNLTKQQQVNLVYKIANESWGDSWLSVMLTYIFEAMISDPIYGFNANEIGWNWIDHQVGLPRPTEALKYDTIFKTIQNQANE